MNIADMHCDTLMKIWYSYRRKDPLSLRDSSGQKPGLQVDLMKMREGGMILQNFALFIDLACPADFDGIESEYDFPNWCMDADIEFIDPWMQLNEMMEIYHREMAANSDIIGEARTFEELEANRRAGKMSGVLTVEEAGALQGKVERLEELYAEGVRMMTLTWNYANGLACPNHPLPGLKWDFSRFYQFKPAMKGNGLTRAGFEMLEGMESLGIIPDVSHLSDTGFWDIVRNTKRPFVASHSNARAVAGIHRNLSDDQLRTIGMRAGVAGLNFYPTFIEPVSHKEDAYASLEGMAKQLRHMLNVAGKDAVGIGADLGGTPPEKLAIPDVSHMQLLPDYLSMHGFTDDEVERICWKNVWELYRRTM